MFYLLHISCRLLFSSDIGLFSYLLLLIIFSWMKFYHIRLRMYSSYSNRTHCSSVLHKVKCQFPLQTVECPCIYNTKMEIACKLYPLRPLSYILAWSNLPWLETTMTIVCARPWPMEYVLHGHSGLAICDKGIVQTRNEQNTTSALMINGIMLVSTSEDAVIALQDSRISLHYCKYDSIDFDEPSHYQ